jgi:DNA-binding transcriptional LysR family regulator
MRLEQLTYLVEVSRCTSISLAASRLFMTQQNISSGIRKLEAELGFELFERTHQGAVLTAKGEEVLVYAKEILKNIDACRLIGQSAPEQLTGELRVELVPYIALPELIVAFYRHNPDVSIKTTEKPPAEIISNIQNGSADVGFVYLRKGEGLQTPSLKQEILSHDQLYFCLSKKLNSAKRSYTMNELIEEQLPLVVFDSLYEWTLESLNQLEGSGKLKGRRPLLYRVDTQLYKKMILEGLAAGFATETGIEREIVFARNEVAVKRIEDYSLAVCMLYKKEPGSPLREGFLAMVREKFSSMDAQ